MQLKSNNLFNFLISILLLNFCSNLNSKNWWDKFRETVTGAGETIGKGAQYTGKKIGEGAVIAGRAVESGARAVGGAVVGAGAAVGQGASYVWTKGDQVYDATSSIVGDIKQSIRNIKDTVSQISDIQKNIVSEFTVIPDQIKQVTKEPIDTIVKTSNILPERFSQAADKVANKNLVGLKDMFITTQDTLTKLLDSTDLLWANLLDKVTWKKPLKASGKLVLSISDSFKILAILTHDITHKLIGIVFNQKDSVKDVNSVLKEILETVNEIQRINLEIIKLMETK